MKVIRLSALRTSRLYPPGIIPGTHFCKRLCQPQGHSAAGRNMSMKNSNDTIGKRTRDLPAWSTVPQPTAPPRTPMNSTYTFDMSVHVGFWWTRDTRVGVYAHLLLFSCLSPFLLTKWTHITISGAPDRPDRATGHHNVSSTWCSSLRPPTPSRHRPHTAIWLNCE
jgi:hypothetical protein